ncbi:SH3 and PX domain-containing protein 2A-like isoform X2 [Mya arenaria]|uniref:SH3 and PX domain-containing protein 2A-like isoform X2 n=1 Tax=Mya arenaria TaxID=6604 RepID=UPI0022E68D7A|nr:SH3 and PX domain-containing protein 2A-like isoform X2 [Mya arenaria]XP_052771632.1 SH3 and PX domain-containing protein 2A-like isoform X2 [Mya arenaria]XP_052771633.1 SH3 and PX domain-containing protein 2A-like isoform X2 [Mya arenaria]
MSQFRSSVKGLINRFQGFQRKTSEKCRKQSIKANKISKPKPLEVYVAVAEYQRQEKGEVSLQLGMLVEVVEKTESGWWFVNVEEEQGWVPSTCLEREDGVKEDTTVHLAPGHEEQYLCTEEYTAQSCDEVSMERGSVVDVMEKNLEGWWLVKYNGREGYVPATYLIKTEAFKIRKDKGERPHNNNVLSVAGPQIVKSLHDISDLLKDERPSSVISTTPAVHITPASPATKPTPPPPPAKPQFNHPSVDEVEDDVFDDDYELPDDDQVYTIHELSQILKEDRHDSESEKIYESIQSMKSRSLKRYGSTRPPPRPSTRPSHDVTPATKPAPRMERLQSVAKEYVTIASFADPVGDGISFEAGQNVKVLEKSDNGWWYIDIEGQEGWAPATYIEESGPTSPRPRPPATSQAGLAGKKSYSQEDLSAADGEDRSSKRQSAVVAIGGLANALKARIQNKGNKSPPTPPKKDFLVGEGHDKNGENVHAGAETVRKLPVPPTADLVKPPAKVTQNTLNIALKPTWRKSADRNLQPPPPPPPGKPQGDSKPNPPPPPVKPGGDARKPLPPTPPSKPATETGSKPPAFALKPHGDSKPSINNKPSLPFKTDKPSPELVRKPVPPAKFVSGEADGHDNDHRPNVSNLAGALKAKFEAKEQGKPVLPGKPKDQTSPRTAPALKPVVNINKPEPPTFNKRPGGPSVPFKPQVGAKPGVSNRPSWVKEESPKTSNNSDSDKSHSDTGGGKVSDLASVLKAKFEQRHSESDGAANTEPKSPRDSGNCPKPAFGKVGLKHFEKPQRPTPPTPKKPVMSVCPSRPAPSEKINSNLSRVLGNRSRSPVSEESSGLDPNKYSARPLPPSPKPPEKPAGAGVSSSNTKPLPAVPTKPGGRPKLTSQASVESTDSSDTDEDAPRGGGVSNLANALKAKLHVGGGGQSYDVQKTAGKQLPKTPVKPKPAVQPKASDNHIKSDIANNNAKEVTDDKKYKAIADFEGSSPGEMPLIAGEIYEYLESADGWWFVASSSSEGWAPSAFLEKASGGEPEGQTGSSYQAINSNQPTTYQTCSDFIAENEGELSVTCGEEVEVLEQAEGGWWFVKTVAGEGWVPATFIQQS